MSIKERMESIFEKIETPEERRRRVQQMKNRQKTMKSGIMSRNRRIGTALAKIGM